MRLRPLFLTCLLAAAPIVGVCPHLATAQQTAEAKPAEAEDKASSENKPDPFRLPEGATEAQAERQLRQAQKQPAESNRPEDIRANYRRLSGLLGDILDRDYSPEFLESVAAMRYGVFNVLDQLRDETAAADREAWIATMKSSDSELLARMGGGFTALQPVAELAMNPAATGEQWAEAVKPSIAMLQAAPTEDGSIPMFELQIAMAVADTLEQVGPNEVAGPTYEAFAEVFAKSPSPRMQQVAESFRSTGRRISLPGSPIVIEGETLDGQPFDLQEDMQGKVVLVDFWATWCGFCIEAFPELKRVYKERSGDGFEIVGVNIDDSAELARGYLKRDPLPWTTIYALDENDSHPNADRYDVRAIPFLVLVGRDGRVISTKVTPDNLDRLVAKALAEESDK